MKIYDGLQKNNESKTTIEKFFLRVKPNYHFR